MLTLLGFAFLAGLVTSLSPCVLVVLPIVLSSSLQKSRAQPIATVVGLMVSFAFFTLFLGTIIQATGISANALRYASIFIVFAFGVTLLLPVADRFISRIFTPFTRIGNAIDNQSKRVRSPILSGLLLGCALGLLWTPCAGPILAAVTAIVATQNITLQAVALVCMYSIGSGVPLLAFAIFGHKLVKASRFLNKHVEVIRRAFGVLMILTSLLLITELDTVFTQAALKFVPSLSIDTNKTVLAELEKVRTQPTSKGAPDFTGVTTWINSPPLTMASLRGKVVLVDFWTYSCINCVRTLPYLTRWHDTYKNDGLVIVGVHTPEFEFEKDYGNVKRATERFGIRYPVALDNDYGTWNAFRNEAWPEHFLFDQNGVIQEQHEGEGDYQKTEEKIRKLLGKTPAVAAAAPESTESSSLTPETYLGSSRAEAYEFKVTPEQDTNYTGSSSPHNDKVSLIGAFKVEREFVVALQDRAQIILNFNASQVYLVMSGSSDTPVKIELDGKPHGTLTVKEARMYEVLNLTGPVSRHLVKLELPKGISAYAFTFGGG